MAYLSAVTPFVDDLMQYKTLNLLIYFILELTDLPASINYQEIGERSSELDQLWLLLNPFSSSILPAREMPNRQVNNEKLIRMPHVQLTPRQGGSGC